MNDTEVSVLTNPRQQRDRRDDRAALAAFCSVCGILSLLLCLSVVMAATRRFGDDDDETGFYNYPTSPEISGWSEPEVSSDSVTDPPRPRFSTEPPVTSGATPTTDNLPPTESATSESDTTVVSPSTATTTTTTIPMTTNISAEGESDDNRTEGEYDDNRTEGESDDNHTEGESDDNRTEGESDDNREEGEHDDNRTEGESDDNREEGEYDDNRTEGEYDDNRTEGESDDNHTEGESDDNRTEGESDDNREEGEHDDNHTEGESDDNRTEGESDDNREEGEYDDNRTEGESDDVTTEGEPQAPTPPIQGTLVCTYGNKNKMYEFYITNATLPADGICDYIFYDSIYANNLTSLNMTPFDPYVASIFDGVNTHRKTQFGTSFSSNYLEKLDADLGNPGTLDRIWNEFGIYHFGILDSPAIRVTTSKMDQVFTSLKLLHDYTQPLRQEGHSSVIALSGLCYGTTGIGYYSNKFQTFKPDIFIAYGHYPFGSRDLSLCVSLPPSMFEKPPRSHPEVYDLTDTARGLEGIVSSSNAPNVFISVGMQSRASNLLSSRKIALFEHCYKDRPFGDKLYQKYAENCRLVTRDYNTTYDAQYAHINNTPPVEFLTWEVDKGLVNKLCQVKQSYPSIEFGVAAYDLEYEDHENICESNAAINKGAFSRLKTLRQIVDYFKGWATVTGNKTQQCLQIETLQWTDVEQDWQDSALLRT